MRVLCSLVVEIVLPAASLQKEIALLRCSRVAQDESTFGYEPVDLHRPTMPMINRATTVDRRPSKRKGTMEGMLHGSAQLTKRVVGISDFELNTSVAAVLCTSAGYS